MPKDKNVEIDDPVKLREAFDPEGAKIAEPEPKPEPKPAPKPGDKDFDWAKLYDTDELFVHTFPNGVVVALKSFTSVFDEVWLYKNRELPDTPLKFSAIDRGSCPAARAVLASLPDDGSMGTPLSDLFSAWTSAATGGLTSGE